MPKPRQGQIKPDGTIATPKPLCKVHKKIMKRIYDRDNGFRPCGWRCPEDGCNEVIIDTK